LPWQRLKEQRGFGRKLRLPIPTNDGGYLTMRSLITSALVSATRQLARRYIWTHPSIAETFRCRPEYQASFKKTWLSLMWGGEAGTRRLRESIAVAISAANQCFY
jgi:Carboxymuconolactone decarboxylase family